MFTGSPDELFYRGDSKIPKERNHLIIYFFTYRLNITIYNADNIIHLKKIQDAKQNKYDASKQNN